jgi:hypothetical protein
MAAATNQYAMIRHIWRFLYHSARVSKFIGNLDDTRIGCYGISLPICLHRICTQWEASSWNCSLRTSVRLDSHSTTISDMDAFLLPEISNHVGMLQYMLRPYGMGYDVPVTSSQGHRLYESLEPKTPRAWLGIFMCNNPHALQLRSDVDVFL